MDFEINEEQKQILSLVRDFCKRDVDTKKLAAIAEQASQAKSPEELKSIQPYDLIDKLHDVGLRQLAIPREYGGTAPETDGNVTRALAVEEAAYVGGPVAFLLVTPYRMCGVQYSTPTISEEQKEWFFSRFLENHHFTMSGTLSEPDGSCDALLPYEVPGYGTKVTAKKDGDEWVINGDKMFSTGGGAADILQCMTRTDKEAVESKGCTFFWVYSDTPGVSFNINRMMGTELPGNVQVSYDNVRVPEEQLIGEVNRGYEIWENIFTTKRLVHACIIGDYRHMYEIVRDYAKQRVQGGRELIKHSAIGAMLGEAAVNLEAARGLMFRAAWEADQWEKYGGELPKFWGQACLWFFKKICLRFCEIACEAHGGVALSREMPIERFIRMTYGTLPAGCTHLMNAIRASAHYNGYELP